VFAWVQWFDKLDSDWESESETSSKEKLVKEEKFPEGRANPLNSKQLELCQLEALARKADLPSGVSSEEMW